MRQRQTHFLAVHRHNRKGGFSLIEVILSVGVLGIAILSLVGLVGASFLQIDNIVQMNRAISVGSTLESALYTPELIGGNGKNITVDPNEPRFNAIYRFVSEAINGKKVTLYCISTEVQNTTSSSTSEKSIIYNASGGVLSHNTYGQLKGVGPVFRIEISIAKQLEEQRIVLKEDGTLEDEVYKGDSLPDVRHYALAYIPLHVAIYAHSFSNVTNAKSAPNPITTLIINFQR
ncbi:MAG: prepilin-type N-terminal cleavage/methylation domain-containing protein [Puniceicoccales bacterium]|jgi:type II secretory pathway pseudopilin PulG|nr:prepilin-type N-terminal cleavage/methylation domain-containing protein [Puniceicoccales bacterium]